MIDDKKLQIIQNSANKVNVTKKKWNGDGNTLLIVDRIVLLTIVGVFALAPQIPTAVAAAQWVVAQKEACPFVVLIHAMAITALQCRNGRLLLIPIISIAEIVSDATLD